MSSHRKERVAELLHAFLAEEMRRLTDPRLRYITVTGVEMSPDLKTARVYWSSITESNLERELEADESCELSDESGGDDFKRFDSAKFLTPKQAKELEKLLEKASGVLKRQIAGELNLRYVPKLVFHYDRSLATSSRIDFLLKKAGL